MGEIPLLNEETFAGLGVPDALVKVMDGQGIKVPFAIQSLTIPDGIAGRDVCGKAQTGSGKTLAFGLSLLSRVSESTRRRPTGLVLVPTRELAVQVHRVLQPLGDAVSRGVCCLYGGVSMETQLKALRRNPAVVVATPGRLIDLLERKEVILDAVEVLVVDEADRMADMGFLPQVEWLMRHIPKERQTMLFSATLDGEVNQLVRLHMRDPASHEVESPQVTVEGMVHHFLSVHKMDKVRVTAAIAEGSDKTIVFVRTKRGADQLATALAAEGVKVKAIHGDLRQGHRESALRAFSQGHMTVLVATDVAARGLDIASVDTVIHFDPPEDHKAYLHRSGRTARAGGDGVVVTLVLWNQIVEIEKVQRRLGLRVPVTEVFSNDPRLRRMAFSAGAEEKSPVKEQVIA
jgi:superfamily II DNA/RNA helicase